MAAADLVRAAWLGGLVACICAGAGACSAPGSPRTITEAPVVWPVPTLGHVSTLVAADHGVLVVENADGTGLRERWRVSRIGPEGGMPSLVAVDQPGRMGVPQLDGRELLWVSGFPSRLRSAPLSGGVASRVLVEEPGWIDGLVLDGAQVYFQRTARVPGTRDDWVYALMHAPRAGGAAEVLEICRARCMPVGVADGKLYFATDDSLVALSLADRSKVVVASGFRTAVARIAGDDLYVLTSPWPARGDATLRVVPRAGGAARTLVTGLEESPLEPPDLVVLPTHVVVLDPHGERDAQLVLVRRADRRVERRATRRHASRIAIRGDTLYVVADDRVHRERFAP